MEQSHKELARRFLLKLDLLPISNKLKAQVAELMTQVVLQLDDERERHNTVFALTSPAIRQALKKLVVSS